MKFTRSQIKGTGLGFKRGAKITGSRSIHTLI